MLAGTPPDSASAGLKSGGLKVLPHPICMYIMVPPPTPDPHLQSIYGPSKLTQIFKKTYYTHTVIQQILTHPKWFSILQISETKWLVY